MNEKKRKKLRQALDCLDTAVSNIQRASSLVDTVCDMEQDSMDNIPENLQSTEQYERLEDNIDQLNEALDHLSDAQDNIQTAIA